MAKKKEKVKEETEKSKTTHQEHMASFESKADLKEKEKSSNFQDDLAKHPKFDKFK